MAAVFGRVVVGLLLLAAFYHFAPLTGETCLILVLLAIPFVQWWAIEAGSTEMRNPPSEGRIVNPRIAAIVGRSRPIVTITSRCLHITFCAAWILLLGYRGFLPVALYDAVRAGKTNDVRVLLAMGLEPDGLSWAATTGNTATMGLLLDHAAPVNGLPAVSNDRPIVWAAAYRRAGAVAYLLSGGARVDAAMSDGSTALIVAVRNDDLATARVLVNAGANVNARTISGLFPLARAARIGDVPMAQMLLQHGAVVNARTRLGFTPLLTATRYSTVGMMRFLLAHGANPRAQAYDKRTALAIARGEKEPAKIALLADALSQTSRPGAPHMAP
jgi:hypothetical protein